MASPRIFVSYTTMHVPQSEVEGTQQLIDDLQRAGAEVITNKTVSDAKLISFLQMELPQCQWFVLMQTAEAIRSPTVGVTMNSAIGVAEKHIIKGVVRVIYPSSDAVHEPLQWSEIPSIRFNGDYHKVRNTMLSELDLLSVSNETGISSGNMPIASLSPSANRGVDKASIGAGNKPRDAISAKKARPLTALPAIRGSRLFRWYAIFALILILIIVGTALLLFRQVSATGSSAPAKHPTQTVTQSKVSLTSIPTTFPTDVPTPTTVSQLTPMLGGNLLAQDTFQRTDQPYWGTASDGQVWQGDANTIAAFFIAGDSGQITNVQLAQPQSYSAILGPATSDTEVTMSGTVNQFANDINTVNLGVVLHWQNDNNFYKALIDGTNFFIIKHVNGQPTILNKVSFPAQGGVTYTLRFRAVGTTLLAKVWPSTSNEPAGWMLTAKDASFTNGQDGIRVLIQNTTKINITAFRASAVK